MNTLLQGVMLASALGSGLSTSHVGQVVSSNTTYHDLEGPIFGDRVGIYHSSSEHGPWSTERPPIPSGDEEYKMILYKAADALDGDIDRSDVKTLPRKARKDLVKVLAKDQTPKIYPALDVIPEDEAREHFEAPEAKRSRVEQSDMGSPSDSSPVDSMPTAQPAANMQLPEERISEDPNADPTDEDLDDAQVVDEDFKPTPQQIKDLKIAHDNCGHPSNRDFARMIRLGNGKPEIARWVAKHFRCDDCQAHRPPKAKRPSAVPRSYRFNHVVGVDLIELPDIEGNKQYWLNSICWGVTQQQVSPVLGGNKTAENVWHTFVEQWLRVYGLPDVVICDPGGEFEGHFAEQLQSYGVTLLPTDARSPWQNGRTERAGGTWKHRFKVARRKCPPVNQAEHEALGKMSCAAGNRFANRSGFSPEQRVFGRSHRLPDSLCSDDAIDAGLLSENPNVDFQRSEEMRRAAMRAWAADDSRGRLQKAFRGRHRIAQHFYEGQLVFVWRQPNVGSGRFHGPGVVIIPTAGGAWINMRGSLWRVASEQLRPATADESRGVEIVNRFLSDMKTDLQSPHGPKKFLDVTREGTPRFPRNSTDDPEMPGLDPDNSDSDDGETRTPMSRLSESQAELRSETTENFPPDTFRGGVALQEPASSVEQPENSRDFDANRSDSLMSPDIGPQRPAPSRACAMNGDELAMVRPPRRSGDEFANDVIAKARERERQAQPWQLVDRSDRERSPRRDTGSMQHFVETSDKVGTQDAADTFFAYEAEATWQPSKEYFQIKKPVSKDAEIKVADLPAKAQQLFKAPGGSREKEWKNMVGAVSPEGGPAVRIHRGKQAKAYREQYSHRIIPSRWHEKWKDMGDDFDNGLNDKSIVGAHFGAKSRWILLGFHDPDIALLNRSVPTPETMDVPLALQLLASIKARAWVGDVKGAFSQGLRHLRPEPLFASPPPGGIPGEHEDILIEVLAEVYGLVTGPPAWRQSLFTTLKGLDFKNHPLAPCVVLMYEKMAGKDKSQLTGLIVVETDDLLGGGTGPKFHDAVEQLKKRYKFGKWKVLMEESTEYGGRTLRQSKDYGFTISMSRYLREKADPIRLERGRGKDQEAEATPQEITQMRGVVGKISWTAREGAPQGAGDASLLAGTFPQPKVKDLTAANAALRRLVDNDVPIKIRPIPLERLVLLSFADSSLNNAGQGKAQLSNIACAADKSIHEGAEADISILAYRSHKNPKAGGSTLLNEAHAFSTSLADGEWIASWIGLAKSLDYDLTKRNTLNREIKIVNIMSTKDCSTETTTVTDAKSLYDAVNQPQYTGAEKRAALEICVIKDSLESLGGQAKWVPHELNPADCLTKLAGNAAPLLELMRRSTYKLVAEEEELVKRKQYREETGKKNPRPNKTYDSCRAQSVNHTVSTQQVFMCLLDSIGHKPQRSESRIEAVEDYVGVVGSSAPSAAMAARIPTTPPEAVRMHAAATTAVTPQPGAAVLFNATAGTGRAAPFYDEWGVNWFTIHSHKLWNLHDIQIGCMLRTLGVSSKKTCRVWDAPYPNAVHPSKIRPATNFGPVQELRTCYIEVVADGSLSKRMYITATVPPIEDMAPCFRYVNVAYFDMDEHKLVEFAKVIPDAPPQETFPGCAREPEEDGRRMELAAVTSEAKAQAVPKAKPGGAKRESGDYGQC